MGGAFLDHRSGKLVNDGNPNSGASSLGNSSSAYASNPLGRVFRDIRTCTLMPPNSDRQMEIIGRAEMGVDSEGDEMLSRLTHFVS